MVDISLQTTVKTSTTGVGRAEPDLDLIKQVEQVTTSDLEGPAWRFAGIPIVGITHAVEVLVFLIWQLQLAVIWLQKQPGMAEDELCEAAGPFQHGLPKDCGHELQLQMIRCKTAKTAP